MNKPAVTERTLLATLSELGLSSYDGWLASGRQVKRGEKCIKVLVFHVSQTEPVKAFAPPEPIAPPVAPIPATVTPIRKPVTPQLPPPLPMPAYVPTRQTAPGKPKKPVVF